MPFLLNDGRFHGLDNAGAALVAGQLFTYVSGTTTPLSTFTDATLATPNTNPVVLNARGEAQVWLGSDVYTFVLKDAFGVTVWSVDGISDPQAQAAIGLAAVVANYAAAAGAALIGFLQAGAGAVARTLQAKARERVSVSDFLTVISPTNAQHLAAINAAIASGAKRIYVTEQHTIDAAPSQLAANQELHFDGGSIVATAAITLANTPNGILYGSAKAGVKIVNAVIDASATLGVTGINLQDCPDALIDRPTLTKCCIELGAASNATRMNYRVRAPVIDMAGWASTAIFVTAVLGAKITQAETFGGLEGIGIYGASRHVQVSDCSSHDHTHDGFSIIDGQHIAYSGCVSYSNGQSGFVTQRLTSGTQAQKISYVGCHAHDNVADGFDLRGHGDPGAYGVNMLITATSCVSYNNGATGFYIVNAEGTTLNGCIASNNVLQGIFGNNSADVVLNGCRAISNATGVAAGTAKAGIFLQACPQAQVDGCISNNTNGATQSYGISFTGACPDSTIAGGNYLNNGVLPFRQDNLNVFVSGAAIQEIATVWINTITGHTGLYDETGNGVPTHTRPKSSVYRRADAGGGGEIYLSSGGGVWVLH